MHFHHTDRTIIVQGVILGLGQGNVHTAQLPGLDQPQLLGEQPLGLLLEACPCRLEHLVVLGAVFPQDREEILGSDGCLHTCHPYSFHPRFIAIVSLMPAMSRRCSASHYGTINYEVDCREASRSRVSSCCGTVL